LAHIRVEYRIGKTALQRWGSIVRKYGYEALDPPEGRKRAAKKTKALVEAKKAQALLNGRGPSTN